MLVKTGEDLIEVKENGHDSVHQSVTFQRSRDLKHLLRRVQSLLDALGDIGGLQGMLFTIAQFTVFVFTFNKFDNYLV